MSGKTKQEKEIERREDEIDYERAKVILDARDRGIAEGSLKPVMVLGDLGLGYGVERWSESSQRWFPSWYEIRGVCFTYRGSAELAIGWALNGIDPEWVEWWARHNGESPLAFGKNYRILCDAISKAAK